MIPNWLYFHLKYSNYSEAVQRPVGSPLDEAVVIGSALALHLGNAAGSCIRELIPVRLRLVDINVSGANLGNTDASELIQDVPIAGRLAIREGEEGCWLNLDFDGRAANGVGGCSGGIGLRMTA